jgi:hypothetical protein
MKKLQIITACSRPQNLNIIKKNIEDIVKISYDWYIIYDQKTDPVYIESENIKLYKNNDPSAFGNGEKSWGLKFKDDYEFVYFLDDDNLLHENFMELFNYIDDTSDIYIFNQKDRMQSGTDKGCTEGRIDTACFLMRTRIIGDLEWHPFDYGADGRFVGCLQDKNVVKFIPKVFCTYNVLSRY